MNAFPGRAPGVLLGVGLGGFVDGILLHQLLQWHHMLTSTDTESSTGWARVGQACWPGAGPHRAQGVAPRSRRQRRRDPEARELGVDHE